MYTRTVPLQLIQLCLVLPPPCRVSCLSAPLRSALLSTPLTAARCADRYSKEDPFTVLNVDIRNFTSLTESLDQYVKGDLLEGANAYHCDKCNRKVRLRVPAEERHATSAARRIDRSVAIVWFGCVCL